MKDSSVSYGELLLIAVVAGLQPAVEWTLGERSAAQYNVLAVAIIGAYVMMRIWNTRSAVLREWGFRTDNFRTTVFPYAIFTVLACGAVWAQGIVLGNRTLPVSFWYLAALYPLWGIAQQFALQNLVVRNLGALLPSIWARAALVALLFGAVHLPSVPLFFEAGIAGLFFVILYHRFPNLFAIGIAHGIIGSLVFHLILGQNQWQILVRYFS